MRLLLTSFIFPNGSSTDSLGLNMSLYKPIYMKTFLIMFGLFVLQAECMVPRLNGSPVSLDPKDVKPISWTKPSIHQSPWVGFSRVEYLDGTEEPKTWDYFYRKTTDPSRDDATAVIATVEMPNQEPALLLIRRYRPAHCKVVVEFPTGLTDGDAGESETETALRELREKTGYGNDVPGVKVYVKSVGSKLAVDPGISNSSVTIVQARIKLDHENVKVVPNLQGGKKIITKLVPLRKLQEYIAYCSKRPDVIVSANVMHFAAGLSFSNLS